MCIEKCSKQGALLENDCGALTLANAAPIVLNQYHQLLMLSGSFILHTQRKVQRTSRRIVPGQKDVYSFDPSITQAYIAEDLDTYDSPEHSDAHVS